MRKWAKRLPGSHEGLRLYPHKELKIHMWWHADVIPEKVKWVPETSRSLAAQCQLACYMAKSPGQ